MTDTMRVISWLGVIFLAIFGFGLDKAYTANETVPLYGLFEKSVVNPSTYTNPFADVELNAVFTSPSGRVVNFFGFFDGDGNGGQHGNVWKQRFMPNELGPWTYELTFSDGTPGASGSFQCVSDNAKPGPWKQHPDNYRWFTDAQGNPFLPKMVYMWMNLTPNEWQDGIAWAQAKGYNTIVTPTFNDVFWGDSWANPTPFIKQSGSPDGAASGTDRYVNYDFFLIKRWKEWDDMIRAAGSQGIYISPTNTPNGFWGGQSGFGTIYPPTELAYFPERYDSYNTQHNIRVIRYFVARQAAFWNVANWSLYPGEIFEIKSQSEVITFGEYLASITPFGRMIGAQDIEQYEAGDLGSGVNRTWLSHMQIPSSRKLNMTQVGPQTATKYQEASENNLFALDVIKRGFPVLGTETLWEGQPRAMKPLRMIWGSFTAGMHTVWADFSSEDPEMNQYISLGHSWTPLKALNSSQFRTDQLGADTVGDEYLAIAGDIVSSFAYWRMSSHNEFVEGSSEVYCLAEPGVQYLVYSPNGGVVKLDLSTYQGKFTADWVNPQQGEHQGAFAVSGGSVLTLNAPSQSDWVLLVVGNIDDQPPSTPTGLRAY